MKLRPPAEHWKRFHLEFYDGSTSKWKLLNHRVYRTRYDAEKAARDFRAEIKIPRYPLRIVEGKKIQGVKKARA